MSGWFGERRRVEREVEIRCSVEEHFKWEGEISECQLLDRIRARPESSPILISTASTFKVRFSF